ncbi:MAG: ferredoxin reductase, partial [Pseudomonadales bacterium]|nr:ferredoxin reductase [Pseudomonadales bacterium]
MQHVGNLGRELLNLVLTPNQYDFWAEQLGSTAAWDRCFARVVQTQQGENFSTLVLRPNRHWRGFRAGQHCNVTASIDGRNITRSYSLSSAPNQGLLEITICREAGGLMSNWLIDHCRVGQRLELGCAFGDGVLGTTLPKGLLLLAAGSGITPIISTVRELAAQQMPIEVTVLY